MIEQEFVLLIMNCKKYVKKAKFQNMTWLKNLPKSLKYYHVIGDEKLENEFYFDDQERILWVKTLDDYNSLPKKVIAAYNAVNETFNFKYIFKTDDDQTLINPHFFNTLIKLLENPLSKVHYGGKIVNVQFPHISQYYRIHPELPNNLVIQPTKYCNGRFYFLSWEAVMNLITKKEKIHAEYFEDYAIGYYLSIFLKDTMLYINSDKHFIDQSEDIISF
jgi:hypothetical protein